MAGKNSEPEYEATILVTRGDEMPKKNYEKKLHPTYEISIRIKNSDTSPHVVVKFFNQYRTLCADLEKEGVGENLRIDIETPFPPSQKSSLLGIAMSEDALQQRCYLLNKWMGAIFASYSLMPPAAQQILSSFLSLNDDDAKLERNKELILELLNKRKGDKNSVSSGSKPAVSAPSGSLSPATSPTAATNRQSSGSFVPPENKRRQSLLRVDTSLTAAEVAAQSAEVAVTRYLALRVTAGEMIPKRPDETKLHRSYETTLRILPYEELADREELDYESYRPLLAIPRVRVMLTFSAYAELKDTLERLLVFSRETPGATCADTAAVIQAPFPRNYAKSSMGLHLSDAEFAQRIAALNTWMAGLLDVFPQLPGPAQDCVIAFFEIGRQITVPGQHDVFLKMMHNVFTATKRINRDGTDSQGGNGKIFGGMFGKDKPQQGGSTSSVASSTPPMPPSAAEEARSNSEREGDEGGGGNSNHRHSMATVAYGADDLAELGRETVVGHYLGVKVVLGRAEKKEGDTKSHHAYDTQLRILPISEVVTADVSEVDAAQYARFSSMAPKSTNRVFDGYRTLKATLQELHVYSRDTAGEAAKDPHPQTVVVDAAFPKTYSKSKLGIGLTEPELQQRVTVLNAWMGALLGLFPRMCEEAQERLVNYLSMEEDNPAEPQNRAIQAILRKTFVAPKKAPVAAPTTTASGKGAKGSKAAKAAAKGGPAESSAVTLGDVEAGQADNAAQPVGLNNKGCGCTIM